VTAAALAAMPAGLRPVWEREGRDWPHRARSRFVHAGGLRWHVQVWGDGPALLLLHGTGASTHSWRDLAPHLATRFTVIAPDLPGHAFSAMPPRSALSLPGMARLVGALLAAMGCAPRLVVGHSAGAAILARLCLDGAIAPAALVSLNGALLPMDGLPSLVFAPVARFFSALPLVPLVFSWRAADRAAVERLLRGTGSVLSKPGIDLYARLFRSPGHVEGALGMMAHWDLVPLARALPHLATPLVLVVGENDRAITPREAERVRRLAPAARIVRLAGLGHLAHEEQPERVAAIIAAVADAHGIADVT